MGKISNAKITGVSISMADHEMLTFWVSVKGWGWGCNVGGYGIGRGYLGAEPDEFTAESGCGLEAMMRIMDAVGVEKWEDLVGKYCRVGHDGPGSTITGIGHIIDEDKWFDISLFFKEKQK